MTAADDVMVIDVLVEDDFTVDDIGPVVDLAMVEPVAAVITVEGPLGPTGPAGDGAQIVGEQPLGAVDDSNAVFTSAHPFRPGSTAVYVNGLREISGEGYMETAPNTITLIDAPMVGDAVRMDYLIA